MFERLIDRAGRKAEMRARARVRELGDRLAAELPAGIGCEADADRVVISGRGLRLRFMVEPALRWIVARGG
jgi:hypothetical protein